MVFYPSQTVTGGDLPVGAMIIVQDHCQSAHANTLYGLEITPDDSEVNPYTPFASQFDWDIAKWAKLHYPGSTQFRELMSIHRVCYSLYLSQIWPNNTFQLYKRLQTSFKSPQELNQIINNKLPGRPLFQHHEVLANNKVYEVYY